MAKDSGIEIPEEMRAEVEGLEEWEKELEDWKPNKWEQKE